MSCRFSHATLARLFKDALHPAAGALEPADGLDPEWLACCARLLSPRPDRGEAPILGDEALEAALAEAEPDEMGPLLRRLLG